MKADKIDIKIVEILENNGRIPNSEIANMLSLSPGTVRNRINRLLDNKLLKIKGLMNPDDGTDNQFIYILVTLEKTHQWKSIAQKVSKLPHVKSVSMITGRFALIIELFINHHHLIDFLINELGKINEISSTETLVTVKNFNKWV